MEGQVKFLPVSAGSVAVLWNRRPLLVKINSNLGLNESEILGEPFMRNLQIVTILVGKGSWDAATSVSLSLCLSLSPCLLLLPTPSLLFIRKAKGTL